MIKKESLPDRPKFCRSGSAVRHLFWRLIFCRISPFFMPVLNHCDTILWHNSQSTLAQVMACCLTAPSHYLNQCWLIISEVLWYFIGNVHDIYLWYEFENCWLKITAASPRDQWVNSLRLSDSYMRWWSGSAQRASNMENVSIWWCHHVDVIMMSSSWNSFSWKMDHLYQDNNSSGNGLVLSRNKPLPESMLI